MERLLLERSNSNIIGTKRYWSAPIETFFVIIGSMLQSYHEPFWTGVNFLWLLERCSNHTKYTYWLDLKNIGSNRTQVNCYKWSDVPIISNTFNDWILRILVPIEPKSIVMTGAMFQSYQIHLLIGVWFINNVAKNKFNRWYFC